VPARVPGNPAGVLPYLARVRVPPVEICLNEDRVNYHMVRSHRSAAALT
jgi:hypothetical protein